MRNIARLYIALGGFLIVSSLILVGIILLILLNLINPEILINQSNSPFFTYIFVTFAITDLLAAIILILDR